MLKFFQDGAALIRKVSFLIVPTIIFVAVSVALDTDTPAFDLAQPLASQIGSFILSPSLLPLLLLAVVVDGIATLYLTADIYFVWKGHQHPFIRVFQALPLWQWAAYVIFTIGWYLLFLSFGIGIIDIADAWITSLVPRFLVILFFATLSFPPFFAGISMSAFCLLLREQEGLPIRETLRYMLMYPKRIYHFFTVRAVLEAGITLAVPLLAAAVFESKLIGLLVTILASGAFLTLTRAASLTFKLDLIKPLLNR